MWQFTYEDVIDQPVAVVFDVMTDLSGYQAWNPFLIKAEGDLKIGGVVSGKSVLGKMTASYRHRIHELVPNKSLCWRDFGFVALFICGFRSRFLESRDGKTHYKCIVGISGPLSGIIALIFGKGLSDGVVAEANALKIEAARRSKQQ